MMAAVKRIRWPAAMIGLAILVLDWVLRPAGEATEPLRCPTTQLSGTSFSSHLEAPLTSGQNVLWCGTFQLAWNEVCALVGEKLHFHGLAPECVAVLNRQTFQKTDLDAASYVAVADFVRNDIFGQIQRQIEE